MPSGTTLCVFTPEMNQAPSANFATPDQRNAHSVLDFDASTDKAAVFGDVLPRNYTAGGITVRFCFMMTSATSGNVVLTGAFERHDDESLDLDADSFATAQSVTVAVPATSGMVQYADLAFTNSQIDGLLAGEHFRFKVTRDADHASDTASGDLELVAVELRET